MVRLGVLSQNAVKIAKLIEAKPPKSSPGQREESLTAAPNRGGAGPPSEPAA